MAAVAAAGHVRLREKLKSEDLLPLKSRIRTHVELEAASPAELSDFLRHVVSAAGNAQLMTPNAAQHATAAGPPEQPPQQST